VVDVIGSSTCAVVRALALERPILAKVHALAQVNVARPRAALDAPPVRAFVAAVDGINRLASVSPGFVWRLISETGHGVCVRPDQGGPILVNLSMWRDYDSLHRFVYRGDHATYLKRRSRWFVAVPQPAAALWWVAEDARPTVEEALRRLRYLRSHGPSPRAFSMRRRFHPDGRPVARHGGRPGAGRSA
jgi:hypothetical protein